MSGRPAIPADIKRQVLIESGHRCAVCGRFSPLELAHIIPWHKSKEHKAENLICLCANCHGQSHKGKWDEKTLREYKKRPYVIRQREKEDIKPKPRISVTLWIDLELEEFNEETERWIQSVLAGFLLIPRDMIRKVFIEKGSLKVTIELPERSAEKLLDAYEKEDTRSILTQCLAPVVLLDLRRAEGERRRAGLPKPREDRPLQAGGPPSREAKDTHLYRTYKLLEGLKPWARLFLILLLVIISWSAVEVAVRGFPKVISMFTGTPPVAVRYDFETGEMGWVPQDKPEIHAIRYVFQSSDTSRTGGYSLGANVKLNGDDANLAEGEVYVNMLQTPPEDITAPVNLENVQVRVWVYIPENVIKEGKIGGIQLFLKDDQLNNLYGSYVDLGPEAKIGFWFPLSLLPGEVRPPFKGYRDPDFNPKKVTMIGLKIDACGEAGCVLDGDIFIDSITW